MADSSNGGSFFEKYGTAVALLLGLIIIAAALYYGRPATSDTVNTGNPSAASVDIESVKTEGNPYIGNADAPVTIAVWFDFQCRFCKQFEATTLKSVKDSYANDGKVKIVYKDYQFLGQASLEAGVYSRAVWEADQDKWDEWFEAVVVGTAGAEATLDQAGLSAAATQVGIDAGRVERLATEKRATYLAAIAADKAEGESYGIGGTPGTIIGTTLVNGAHTFLATGRAGEQPIQPLIEAELN